MRGNKHTGRKHKNQNKKTRQVKSDWCFVMLNAVGRSATCTILYATSCCIRPSVIAAKRRNKDIDQVHEDLKAVYCRSFVTTLLSFVEFAAEC